jgi:ATP-dependent exoDNAse (exonuclease V) beta subunit|tara:strand:- start:1022 stop:1693 length:672 start_codon:yes stop_codon:yes gene_type:complete
MKIFDYELFEAAELKRINANGKRLYLTETGERYPSVTTVLSYFSKKGIAKWRARVGAAEANRISTQASGFGTAVHNIAEKYTLGILDAKKENPIALSSFQTIQPYLDENVDNIYGIETRMYSHELKTAGTADLICRYAGKNTLLDFKTSRKRKTRDHVTTYFMQCAAYAIMVKELYDMDIEQIVILMAVREDNNPIIFVEDIEPWIKMTRKFFELHNSGKLPL